MGTLGGSRAARRRLGGALFLVLLLAAGGAGAEETPLPQSVAPVPFPGYKVALGDRIQLSVWGEPTLTTDTTVMPDGTASLPLIGTVTAVGKTAPELMEEIRTAYSRYLRDPRLSLSCLPRNPPRVYFEGAVGKPGPVEYDPRFRLLDYLALAGGPGAGADLSRVVITSLNGSEVSTATVDIGPAAVALGPAANPELKPGDTVWIGRALPVSVVGAVLRAGSFDYRPGLRLSDYLAQAGGPSDHAARTKVVLKRVGDDKDAVRTLDLTQTLKQPDSPEANPVLLPGDVVTVPLKLVGGTLSWGDVVRTVLDSVFIWHHW